MSEEDRVRLIALLEGVADDLSMDIGVERIMALIQSLTPSTHDR